MWSFPIKSCVLLWIRSKIYCFRHNVSGPWPNLFFFLYRLKDDLCQKCSRPLSLSLSHYHSLNGEAWGLLTSLLLCQSLTCTGPPAVSPVFTSGPQHGAKEYQPMRLILSAGGLTTELVCFWKWAPAWSSTPTSQMAIRVDIWNNALDWQTSLPACPRLTSRGGHQFRLFSSGRMVVGLPAPDSETPPPPPPEPPG